MNTTKIDDLPRNDVMAPEAMAEVHGGMLTARKRGENPIEYLQITMPDAMIMSVSTGE